MRECLKFGDRLESVPSPVYILMKKSQLIEGKFTLAPTDLSNFLSCRHSVFLDLQAANGKAARPVRRDAWLDELRARGHHHEKAYLKRLQSEGLTIAGLDGAEDDKDPAASSREITLARMREGVDVIYQATLADDDWAGRVDFLRKVDTPSGLGNWSYEVYDTKLARETRSRTMLQLCVYSYLLGQLQDFPPDYMHVVAPGSNFRPSSYRVDEYAAYFSLLKQDLHKFSSQPDDTYPEKVAHCDYCSWWADCEARRREDDHLCYVAGISATQIKSLRAEGVERLAQLAALDPVPEPAQGSRDALIRVREQARVQDAARKEDAPYYELKEPFDVKHGLAMLPEPAPGDIFLDIEGNHFAETGVQEYLIGYMTNRPDGSIDYTARWATSAEDEQAAFEEFMDVAVARRKQYPRAHIYHFAPYEPEALKRLMGRYATREAELDDLLQASVFVDLHKVVKRALVAGVERYSIKDLEPFFNYRREQDVRVAAMSCRLIETAMASGDGADVAGKHFQIVEDYNREDCEAAARLRDWLEQIRNKTIAEGHALRRPELKTGAASGNISALDRKTENLRNRLIENIPANADERSEEQQARFVLAHLIEFHRREDKANSWEYFRLLELDASELAGERRALTGLRHEGTVEPGAAPVERYTFPPQELDARKKDDVYTLDGSKVGTVVNISHSERTIDIKKLKERANFSLYAGILHNQIPSDVLRQSLMWFAETVLQNGFELEPPYRAGIELLLRSPPPAAGPNGALKQPGEETAAAACRIALALDGNVLAIQGPPGTGKTFTGARVICELVRAGRKVGVTAFSHKVIVNLLETVAEQAHEEGLSMSLVHKQEGEYEGKWGIRRENEYKIIRPELENNSIDVLGATAWCWARENFLQAVDVLVVDEAGQMSLANVLACAPAARSLVLLGDPQQLEQPLKSRHPEGSDVSALYHLSEGKDTLPADRGLFLSETYRLHPDIARFTSEVYYESKIKPRPGLKRQEILSNGAGDNRFTGSGLRYMPVDHQGNHARSLEEVGVIGNVVDTLLNGYEWRDGDGKVQTLTEDGILIVAPYNAQVSALAEAMPALAGRIGTVDRFQGQEAPVVIYSMTSSSPEDAPRGMEFLYNSFRFNVATSRARAMCILVGSGALFRPDCRTPQQIKLANGFCRYIELARTVEPG